MNSLEQLKSGAIQSGGLNLLSLIIKVYLFSAAHLKPTLLNVLVGSASRRMALRKYSAGSLHEPPLITRYFPISGPCGFEELSL